MSLATLFAALAVDWVVNKKWDLLLGNATFEGLVAHVSTQAPA